ncbi:MAG TPA: hypothetical protein PKA64_19320, partial [Myxococcota bacterium]|nr:hypothetical protein [Myxococcota bacterium]
MADTTQTSPREVLASAIAGGGVVGLADGLRVALVGRLGLGPIGIVALALLGVAAGSALGGGGAWLVCALRRFRVRRSTPFVIAAALV